jgi:hypothetical protein
METSKKMETYESDVLVKDPKYGLTHLYINKRDQFERALELQAQGRVLSAKNINDRGGSIRYENIVITPETKKTLRRSDLGSIGECYMWVFDAEEKL